MIFGLILIVVVGVIAFFHYIQGFFTATLSAILAVISAALAFSFHEPVVESLLGGKLSGTAHGSVLAVLFLVIYSVLRLAFDKMVPGNVRMPVLVDKIGAGVMGLIAGVFGAGMLALVWQYMPLMPSIAQYSRYATTTRETVVPPGATQQRAINSENQNELKSDKQGGFDPAERQKLVLPADDVVVGTVAHLSDRGSLAGSQPLTRVHPDFIEELFAQRLGIQARAKRVVTADGITSVELFSVPSLKQRDHEYKEVRSRPFPAGDVKPPGNQVLLIARVMFTRNAGDDDGLVRFAPASLRLVGRKPGSGASEEAWVNYYPVGTVEKGQTLYANKPDDYLFLDVKGADRGVDFAFLVDKQAVLAGGGQGGGTVTVADGVFLEFKRMARKDLTGEQVKTAYKASETVGAMRKKDVTDPNAQQPAQTTDASAQPPPQPEQGTPAPADATAELKEKLVGAWMGSTADGGTLVIDFLADGNMKFQSTAPNAAPQIRQGTWEAVSSKGNNALVINRTIGGGKSEVTITFNGDDDITLASTATPKPIQLKRR